MANTYFDFKKFRIEQSNCANKVSTDACVFGAWISRLVNSGFVLDVGCGSGLLSLMIAQGKATHITGIELEENCTLQAQENVSQSKFANKIDILNADARHWKSEKSFDWIISNPPFFNNTYKNIDSKKNQARQTETLSAKDWLGILANNSSNKTTIAFLLSNNDVLNEYEQQCSNLGYLLQRIELFDHKNANCKRVILFASKKPLDFQLPKSFIYKKQDSSYTAEMTTLLDKFYLYL